MYWEVDHDYEETPKICPLTGKTVNDPTLHDCYRYKCNSVKHDLFFDYKGYIFRCNKEYQSILRQINKILDAEKMQKIWNDSIEIARMIDINAFYSYCATIDKYLILYKQRYDENMSLCPYLPSDKKFIFYLFENDKVVDINVGSNMFSYFNSQRLILLKDEHSQYYVGYCSVPSYLADAILVKQRLLYNMDVKIALKNDNPVYIKSQYIRGFMCDVYGLDGEVFRQLRKKHLEMTEIANFNNVIYLKQEIDEIIRHEVLLNN